MQGHNERNITDWKELDRFVSEITPIYLGDALTIVSHPFSNPVTNGDLMDLATLFGIPDEQKEIAFRAIQATGFSQRYFSKFPGENISVENLLTREVEIGSRLLSTVMKSKGWDGIDMFIDTSAFLPEDINDRVLHRLGLNHVYSRSYRYACAGAVGAFIDCLSDPDLQDARVVIGAMEPLSYFVNEQQFLSPEGIAFPSIFGDAHAFMAFNPKDFQLDSKKIVIQPDGGVIKMNAMYQLPKSVDAIESPSHYCFVNEGNHIFHYTDRGAFLDISRPDNGMDISMDGKATGFFFGDKTAAVLIDLLTEFQDVDLLKTLGEKNLVMHPASKPVVDRIAKLLYRGGYKYLDRPSIPFLMDKALQSNGSSATTINRWAFMIENNLIDTSHPVVWLAPGIGSAIAGAVGWINA